MSNDCIISRSDFRPVAKNEGEMRDEKENSDNERYLGGGPDASRKEFFLV